eukprot:TRINITY_DN696_c0_g3_i5.p1 TRINITY_DN696_c0_g3~~TRINITY_DN696_c0_g3_i5.p1  ORF type:complete len:290 (-),score=59.75 TRINITY_DN696_c0_g3_i5:414-1283(-)
MYNSSSLALGGKSFMKAQGGAASNEGGYFVGNGGANDAGLQGSPTNQKTSKSPTDHRSLLPVVVRQIHSADNQNGEDQFWVDGREIAQVTAVGLVTKLSEQSTFVSFYLDDGTGKIQVRMFFDEAQRESIVESSYVRVFGRVRTHANQRGIIAFKIANLIDHNEITYHTLEVLFVHCHNTNSQAHNGLSSKHSNVTPMRMNGANTSNGYQSSTKLDMMFDEKPSNLGALENSVLDFIRTYGSPSGPSVDEITIGLRIYDRLSVCRALETLSTEAFLYTTIDDQHYQIIS